MYKYCRKTQNYNTVIPILVTHLSMLEARES